MNAWQIWRHRAPQDVAGPANAWPSKVALTEATETSSVACTQKVGLSPWTTDGPMGVKLRTGGVLACTGYAAWAVPCAPRPSVAVAE